MGYPAGLRGEAIPMESRIIAVVDAFDAMVGGRSAKTSALSPSDDMSFGVRRA